MTRDDQIFKVAQAVRRIVAFGRFYKSIGHRECAQECGHKLAMVLARSRARGLVVVVPG